jgi:hypothetical protein
VVIGMDVDNLNKVSLNDYVKFTLTERGEEIVEAYRKELNNRFDYIEVPKESIVKTDESGLQYMQLWEFMRLFGEYMSVGSKPITEGVNLYFKKGEVK